MEIQSVIRTRRSLASCFHSLDLHPLLPCEGFNSKSTGEKEEDVMLKERERGRKNNITHGLHSLHGSNDSSYEVTSSFFYNYQPITINTITRKVDGFLVMNVFI